MAVPPIWLGVAVGARNNANVSVGPSPGYPKDESNSMEILGMAIVERGLLTNVFEILKAWVLEERVHRRRGGLASRVARGLLVNAQRCRA
eukprot:535487-Pleurochrysis_carterae.AAC.1